MQNIDDRLRPNFKFFTFKKVEVRNQGETNIQLIISNVSRK